MSDEEENEMAQDEDIEMVQDQENDTVQYGDNDCHLCNMIFTALDDLCEHFRTSHTEYHENIQKNVAQYLANQ